MAGKGETGDSLDFDPSKDYMAEVAGEQAEGAEGVAEEPSPEALETFGAQVKETVADGMRASEKTPDEVAQIEALQETLSAQKTETEPPSASVSQGEEVSESGQEITPEGLEMANVNSELEEYLGENPQGESLEVRLVEKEEANRDSEKKSFKRFGWTGAGVGVASGVSAIASAGGLGGAVMAGGFGAAALGGLFAAPAILAVGGAYWGGKKLWNKYKENKARKNIDTVRGRR